MSHNTAVFGIYEQESDIANASQLLRSSGFRASDFSSFISQNLGNKDLALARSTKAPEGAILGAILLAIVGAALGWAGGSGVWKNIALLAAAGPIVSLLCGVGVGGFIGAVIGALAGAARPEFEIRRYEGRKRKGHALFSVHCDNPDWVTSAKDILKRSGAQDVTTAPEATADFDASDRTMPRRHDAEDYESSFRHNFESMHFASGALYEDYAPLYEYGFRMANDPRYRGRTFAEVESDLRKACPPLDPYQPWDRISSAVLFGWERAGGKVDDRAGII